MDQTRNRPERVDEPMPYLPYLIAIAVLAVFVLLISSRQRVGIIYCFDEDPQNAWLRVRVGWFSKIIRLGKKDNQKKEKKIKKDIKKSESDDDIIERIRGYHEKWQRMKPDAEKLLDYAKEHIKIDGLTIDTEFGFSDAATTGIAAGLIYTLCYTVAGAIDNKVGIKKLKMNIKPCFTEEKKRVYIDCCLKTSIANLIRIGFMAVQIFSKIK